MVRLSMSGSQRLPFHEVSEMVGEKRGHMDTEVFIVDDMCYRMNIHYEKRRTARASIRRTTVTIRIPSSLSRKQRKEELTKLRRWAIQKIQEDPQRFKPFPQRVYRDGENIVVGSKEYTIRVSFEEKKSSSAKLVGTTVYLFPSSECSSEVQQKHMSSLVSRCIAWDRLPDIQARIQRLNRQHFNRKVKRVVLRYNRSNWGSCSRIGTITLSTRVLFAPDDVIDYICIHELAHLVDPSHSKRFWSQVERAMPDYKEKERWLKKHGSECYF
jgi:predicted metal-dependent hydrolase